MHRGSSVAIFDYHGIVASRVGASWNGYRGSGMLLNCATDEKCMIRLCRNVTGQYRVALEF